MASSLFRVTEHVIEAQHIREYARATTSSQEETLNLHVKQYTPKQQSERLEHAVTIIGAHANGFPKELYEPMWREINHHAVANGFSIRNIWIADVAHQGQSGVLNESYLGNDPSWFDHSRDLLHMVNHFRREMPRPIVGIGHSFGGTQLVDLALIHPRLFVSLVLIDPVIELGSTTRSDRISKPGVSFDVANASTYRRDLWPSRDEAAEAFAKSSFYQRWDPRVLDLWTKYGLRELPTAIYPEKHQAVRSSVTLTTTKHQEVWTFLRPNYEGHGVGGSLINNRLTHPDVDPSSLMIYPFYRPESAATYQRLPLLRPSTLYIMGELSDLSPPGKQRDKVKITGIGPGGSGGLAEAKVKDTILPGVGHLIPMEVPNVTAELVSSWLGKVLHQWREDEKVLRESREGNGRIQHLVVDEEWLKHIGEPPSSRRRKQKL